MSTDSSIAANAKSTASTKRLGVVGLGLIGGSLALATRREGWQVAAYNRNAATARDAAAAGHIDVAVEKITDLADCDIVFLAVPMSAYGEILQTLAPALAAHTIITDCGSTKQDAIAAAQAHLGDAVNRFVPAHPIAGKEESGWHAASADLFADRLTILCPDHCTADAVAAVTQLWRQAGARTCEMNAAEHDTTLATVSHLPHVLSYALVSAIDKHPQSAQLLRFAAGGFRDFTRIAGSHPQMWRDICMANADNLLDAIEWYQQELAQLAHCIKTGDDKTLTARFDAARTLRRQWLDTLEQ